MPSYLLNIVYSFICKSIFPGSDAGECHFTPLLNDTGFVTETFLGEKESICYMYNISMGTTSYELVIKQSDLLWSVLKFSNR
jgi:hypothetical protein